MKKVFKLFMLALPMMLGLASCVDNDDNPANPAEEPSAVDNGKWKVTDSHMDKSVRPGDDFFMYCNGGYWNNTTVDEIDPFMPKHVGGLAEEMKKREAALTIPSKVKTLADAEKTDAATIKAQKDRLQSAIDRVNALSTKEDAWKLVAELYKEGYRTPFELITFAIDGKMVLTLSFYAVKDYADSQLWSKQSLSWQLANNPDLLARVRPLKGAATRGFDNEKWPMLVTFFNTLGISLDDVYTIDTHPDCIVDGRAEQLANTMLEVQDWDIETWKRELKETLEEDAIYFDDSAAAAASTTCLYAVNKFLEKYLGYELSRAFAQAYVTAEQKQSMAGYAEEMRQTLRERIQQYDWMSDASKQNATEKINHMIFNIGAPDEWFDEGIADLSQAQTLYDDIRALRSAKMSLNCKLTGMTSKRAGFHQVILDMPLTTVNACYVPAGNYMNILPAFILTPNYDPDMNDAHNYANMLVWGHEIIHGFDTNGAKFDQYGNLGSLWANENDNQEFQKRAQQLIDYYSSLDIMPFETGLKNDGAFTVAENVADLGGFYLAYESYVKHLKKQGFTGDRLRLQQQRFYEAYAYFLSAKWTAEYANNNTLGNAEEGFPKNEHSLFRERVNGVVTNTDDWYDLFDVKPTDKLYLAPEKRIRIW